MGCGGSGAAKTSKVTGKLTDSGGAPVKGAAISFAGSGSKPFNATGTTGDDGSYSLSTFDTNDGAPPGDYNVTVTVNGQGVKVSPATATVADKANTIDLKLEGAIPPPLPAETPPPAEETP
jgi:hypothetical protein